MIPGGQVLWRACIQLDMTLDKTGFKVRRSRKGAMPDKPEENAQYELPFINESPQETRYKLRSGKRTANMSMCYADQNSRMSSKHYSDFAISQYKNC